MTRDELVRAVIAAPDDDGRREAFAAWGVANGDPQGKLARLQLDERRERREGSTESMQRLEQEARALVEVHGGEWARQVLAIASQPRFFRGFVEAITIDVPTFLARAPALFGIAPIRSVTFVDAGPDIAALAASPHLARLVKLRFYNKSNAAPLEDAGLRTLVGSPNLGKLAILEAPLNGIGRGGYEALAASKTVPDLIYTAFGNLGSPDNPVEQYGTDGMTGEINQSSIELPAFGRELEVKYGPLRWLHAPSLCRMFPPDERDV